MLFQKKNTFCLFDIGSYKISCSVVVIENGKTSVLYNSSKKSDGYSNGLITSSKTIKNIILSLVIEAEKDAKVNIEKVIVNVSALKISKKTAIVEDSLMGRQVLKEDVKRLINKSLSEINSSKQEIIHFFPIRFCLDDITVVKNPERLFAEKLECEVNLLFVDRSLLFSIASVFADCHLKVDDFVLDIFASAIAVCREDELSKTMVIDMGHEVTSFAYFENKALLEYGAIRIGGKQITQDIKSYFNISFSEAEKIKHHHCQGYGEENFGDIDPKILDKVISSRVEEILEEVKRRCPKKAKQIKLVGGSTKLPDLVEIVERTFKINASLGKIISMSVDGDRSFAEGDFVIAGMYEYLSKEAASSPKHNVFSGPLKKVLSWLKDNF